MDYEQELTAIQTWIKLASGLNSWKRTAAPPKLPRPVVLWESPYRSRARHLNRYAYTQTVKYYGKLFINSVDEVLRLQNLLIADLENRCGVLAVSDDKKNEVGFIKAVEIAFSEAEGLDVPFTLSYEASYSRQKPAEIPPPKYVYTKVTSNREQQNK